MASRKQRRRRAKEQRHEWEYVEIDPETGEERVLEPPEVKADKEDGAPKPAAGARRPGRVVQPPSWQRVLKRGLIFAPIMFLTVTLLGANLTQSQRVAQTVMLLAFFLPFSYVMDSITYRMYLKRTGTPAQPKGKKT
jgi:hypothetical protein